MTEQLSLFDTQALQRPVYPNLDAIATACNVCQRCPLSRNRTQAVLGRGRPQAEVLIVGEAPGEQEDRQGKPFVGRSGQLLDTILSSVGIEDAYLTNAVCCRPPDNRTPTPSEVKSCRPYLVEQIRLIKPRAIVCLGATALRALTGERRSLTSIRGRWLTYQGIPAVATFHPAYLLRHSSLSKGSPKWLVWHDFCRVRLKLEAL